MICTFFGHKDTDFSKKEKIKMKIVELIQSNDVTTFYVGNNGNFDFMIQNILEELSKENESISYSIVLSYINERALSSIQSKTIFPEGLEKVPPRFSISKRNEWLIKNSDFAIVYSKYNFSNSYKWATKAIKNGLTVINLCDTE